MDDCYISGKYFYFPDCIFMNEGRYIFINSKNRYKAVKFIFEEKQNGRKGKMDKF